jgi:hypothetical protein
MHLISGVLQQNALGLPEGMLSYITQIVYAHALNAYL